MVSMQSDEIHNGAVFRTVNRFVVNFDDSVIIADASELRCFTFFNVGEVVATVLVLEEKTVAVVVFQSDETGQRRRSIRVSARLSSWSIMHFYIDKVFISRLSHSHRKLTALETVLLSNLRNPNLPKNLQ